MNSIEYNKGTFPKNEIEELIERKEEAVPYLIYYLEDLHPRECYESIKRCFHKEEKIKIGRNDPCPCGSGKKYKKCCGK